MNAKYLVAVSLVVATGSAMADGLSRADVRGELEREYAAGNYTQALVPEAYGTTETARSPAVAVRKIAAPEANTAGGKTRAEVRAELEKEYLAGNYARPVVPEAAEPTNVASTRSRDEVRNEAMQAARGTQAKDTRFGG